MTQPLMYNLIEAKRSVRKLYTEAPHRPWDISQDEADAALRDYQQQLERVFVETAHCSRRSAFGPRRSGTDVEGRRPRPAALSSPPTRHGGQPVTRR